MRATLIGRAITRWYDFRPVLYYEYRGEVYEVVDRKDPEDHARQHREAQRAIDQAREESRWTRKCSKR